MRPHSSGKAALVVSVMLAVSGLCTAVSAQSGMELSSMSSMPAGISLDTRWARRDTARVRVHIDACFDEARTRDPALLGILEVRLFLSKGGSPGIIQVNGAEGTVAQVKACVMGRLKKTRVRALARRYEMVTLEFQPPGESGIEVVDGPSATGGRRKTVEVGPPKAKPTLTVAASLRAAWSRRLSSCVSAGPGSGTVHAELVLKIGKSGYVDGAKVVAKKVGKATKRCLVGHVATFRFEHRRRPYRVKLPLELSLGGPG